MKGRPCALIGLLALGSLQLVLVWGCSQRPNLYLDAAPSSGSPPAQREELPSWSSLAPGASPSAVEEIWVIQKAEPDTPAYGGSAPGTGVLRARLAEGEEVAVPLEHTNVTATIAGYIATVDVTQEYHNPFAEKIEAVYVFPLPENAAVSEFLMTIGDRRIRGIIREREEAKRIYREARSQGYVASLLTQERPNVFTQAVANIEPNHEIDINIKYFHTLAFDDGWFEFVFPMVVGPRFNPRGTTDGIGAVAQGQAGVSGQSTEVQYLSPGQRNGHDIGLELTIDAGVKIEQLRSVNHQIAVNRPAESRAVVRLDELDAIPNKDFVLRYKVTGNRIKTALLTHHDQRGDYFTLMLYPPEHLTNLHRVPMEMIFVLDCSGSMKGPPLQQAQQAIRHALTRMQPDDTFQIIRFSNKASQLGNKPLPATQKNVLKGLRYVQSLQGRGGTMMIEGIRAALDFPHDERRLRTVVFLTDGYIGNEAEIFAEVNRRLGASRIFSFGVGSSPNRYALNGLARIGRGAVAYLSLNDNAGEIMDAYFERVSHPALTDVTINWGNLEVSDVFPQRPPDLFAGRPIMITGRFRSATATTIEIAGNAAGEQLRILLPVDPATSSARCPGLPQVWARHRIADYARRQITEPAGDWATAIKQVALEYGLMSNFTAFVAVDSTQRTAGDHGTTVAVPVPVPEGVRYETTVDEGSGHDTDRN